MSGTVNRRSLLLGAAAGLVVAACGGDTIGDQAVAGDTQNEGIAPVQLFPGFAYSAVDPGILRPGSPQRAPFVLLESDGAPLVDGPDTIDVDLMDAGGALVSTHTLVKHAAGIPSPYYPMLFTVDESGTYTASTTIEGVDSSWEFFVAEADKVALAQPGDALAPVPTPTADEPLATEPICTRNPPCPFHERSHADIVGTGRPTVLLVSTPAYCQTVICGPVLDLLIDVAPDFAHIDMVHAEVYKDAAETGNIIGASLTEAAVIVPGALFEPSLILTDGEGMVIARLDFTYDRDELIQALSSVT